MISCDICSKEFNTQRRYMDHRSRCVTRATTVSANTTTLSARRDREKTTTDDECGDAMGGGETPMFTPNSYHRGYETDRTDRTNRSRLSRIGNGSERQGGNSGSDTLEVERLKLANQKLRIVVNDCKDELYRRTSELERTVEKYEGRIDALTREKDELANAVSVARGKFFEEKEQIRQSCTDKIAEERKRIETQYRTASENYAAKIGGEVASLQKTLAERDQLLMSLQSQMQQQMETHKVDLEKARLHYEQDIKAIILDRDNIILGLEAEVKKLQNQYDRDKVDTNTKKDQEIAQVVSEWQQRVKVLNERVASLSSNLSDAADKHAEHVRMLQSQNEERMAEARRRFEESTQSMHDVWEGKLRDANAVMRTSELKLVDAQAEIVTLRELYDENLRHVRNQHTTELENIRRVHEDRIVSMESQRSQTNRQYETTIEQLQLAYSRDIDSKIAQLASIDDVHQKTIEKIKTTHDAAIAELFTARDQQQAIITALEQARDVQSREIKRLHEELEKAEHEHQTSINHLLHTHADNIEQLRAEHDKCMLRSSDAHSAALNVSRQEITSREAHITSLEAELAETQRSLQARTSEVDALRTEHTSREHDHTTYREQTQMELQKQKDHIRILEEVGRTQLADYKDTLERLDRQYDRSLVDIRAENTALRTTLAQATAELEQTRSTTTGQIARLQKTLEAEQHTHSAYHDRTETELKKQLDYIRVVEESNKKMQTDFSQKLSVAHSETATLRTENEQLSERLRTSEAQLADYKGALEKLDRQYDRSLADIRAENNTLRTTLAQATAELEQTRATMTDQMTKTQSALETEQRSHSSYREQAETALKKQQDYIRVLKESNKKLQADFAKGLGTAQSDAATLRTENEHLGERLRTSEAQLADYKGALEKLDRQYDRSLADIRAENNTLRTTLAQTAAELEQTQTTVAEKTKELHKTLDASKKRQDYIRVLEESNKKMQNDNIQNLSTAQSEIDALRTENERLRSSDAQLQQSRTQLADYKDALERLDQQYERTMVDIRTENAVMRKTLAQTTADLEQTRATMAEESAAYKQKIDELTEKLVAEKEQHSLTQETVNAQCTYFSDKLQQLSNLSNPERDRLKQLDQEVADLRKIATEQTTKNINLTNQIKLLEENHAIMCKEQQKRISDLEREKDNWIRRKTMPVRTPPPV